MRLPGATRPVGEPVPVFPRRGAPLAWPAGYEAAWFDRGTTALAIAARALVLAAGRPEPRIVLPAYTCPDVVGAVLWAGAVPVLADTLPGLPWLDEAALQQHHDASWVGVIAPHFLGLRHPLGTLQSWCRSVGIGLIEDSAQLGPRSPAFQPIADLVVLSFGRGKPIPAGGGALLFRGEHGGTVRELAAQLETDDASALCWRSRALMHDVALTRPGYWLASCLPWLYVGETRYGPLRRPRRLGDEARRLAEAVIAGWQDNSLLVCSELGWRLASPGYASLAEACGWSDAQPLLRFPLMAKTAEERHRIYRDGRRHGLGVSAMYESILAEVDAAPPMLATGNLGNARDFASRLLTLPVHTGVTPADLEMLFKLLNRGIAEKGSPVSLHS
jgi:hypothetical protein